MSKYLLVALLVALLALALGNRWGYKEGRTEVLMTHGVMAEVYRKMFESCRSRNELLTKSIDSLSESVGRASYNADAAIRLYQDCRRESMDMF